MTSCFECVADQNCGWCAVSQECMVGSTAGPTAGYCVGEYSWDFDPGSCKGNSTHLSLSLALTHPHPCSFSRLKKKNPTDCTKIAGCRNCIQEPDCQWCADSTMPVLEGLCKPLSTVCENPVNTCRTFASSTYFYFFYFSFHECFASFLFIFLFFIFFYFQLVTTTLAALIVSKTQFVPGATARGLALTPQMCPPSSPPA